MLRENLYLQRKKVYLAGGFRSGWQRTVKLRLRRYEVLDPSAHGLADPTEYTRWDLDAIRQSDVILANAEASNPGGYALALEVGFAKALRKIIVFVDQIDDAAESRYWEMVRQCADQTFVTLEEAIRYLYALEDDGAPR